MEYGEFTNEDEVFIKPNYIGGGRGGFNAACPYLCDLDALTCHSEEGFTSISAFTTVAPDEESLSFLQVEVYSFQALPLVPKLWHL